MLEVFVLLDHRSFVDVVVGRHAMFTRILGQGLISSRLLRQMFMLKNTMYPYTYCLRNKCSRFFCDGISALGRLGFSPRSRGRS